jgi:hypothetical protein
MAENNIRKYKDPIKKSLSEIRRDANSLRIRDRQRYMAKTLKAGADEFNNANLKPRPSGQKPTTGEVARLWREKLIRSGKVQTAGVRNSRGAAAAIGMEAGTALGKHLGSLLIKSAKEHRAKKAGQSNMYGRY